MEETKETSDKTEEIDDNTSDSSTDGQQTSDAEDDQDEAKLQLIEENQRLKDQLRTQSKKHRELSKEPEKEKEEQKDESKYATKEDVESLKQVISKDVRTYEKKAVDDVLDKPENKHILEDEHLFEKVRRIYSSLKSETIPTTFEEVKGTLEQAVVIATGNFVKKSDIAKQQQSEKDDLDQSAYEKSQAGIGEGSTTKTSDAKLTDKEKRIVEKYFGGDTARYLKTKQKKEKK